MFTNGAFEENCYLAIDEKTRDAVVIDPGSQPENIINWIKKSDCHVKYVLNTHGHSDHIGANTAVCEEFNVKLGIHPLDAPMLTDTKMNLSSYWGDPVLSKKADFLLNENDTVKIGDNELRVIHTPGHTPGGICLVDKDFIFSGDSLFAGSVGRTDFPGGSMTDLIKNLKEKIMTLPDSVHVYPGHGSSTTISEERTYNPYFSG